MSNEFILPDNLQELAKNMALGNVLSDYSDLSWDEVIASLENDDDGWVSDDRISVWYAFEDQPARFILEQLDSLRREFLSAISAGYTWLPEQPKQEV